MKKFYLLALLLTLGLCTNAFASSDDSSKRELVLPSGEVVTPYFPSARTAQNYTASPKKIAAPTVNNDDRGVDYYVSLLKAFTNEPSMAIGNTAAPNEIERLYRYYGYNDNEAIRCGTYHNGKYYGFMVALYTYEERPVEWVSIDLKNGLPTTIRYAQQDFDTDPAYNKYHYFYEMDYDYTRDKAWAIGLDNTSVLQSTLYEVNLELGQFTKKVDLTDYYYAFTVDHWGNLWGIRPKRGPKNDYGQDTLIGAYLSQIDPETGEYTSSIEITLNGDIVMPNYAQTMTFDHSTGKLYWIAYNFNKATKFPAQQVWELDTKTGKVTEHGQFATAADQGVGLYIPFVTADNADSPARVDNINATPAEGGKTEMTLGWEYPSKTWKGDELKDITTACIYRGDELIATLDCAGKVGQKDTYVDTDAAEGENTYTIVINNAAGKGVPETIKCVAGIDAPGLVQNLTVSVDEATNTVKLNWDKPAMGANKGWYDDTKIRYAIMRYPDYEYFDDIEGTEFTDVIEDNENLYIYIVGAYDEDYNYGPDVQSEAVRVGNPYEVPFNCTFEEEVEGNLWRTFGPHDWTWTGDGENGPFWKALMLDQNGTEDCDDWAFSPKLSLKSGKDYRVTTLMAQFSWDSNPQDFYLTIGKTPDPKDHTKVFGTHEGFKVTTNYEAKQFDDFVTVDEDGVYFIGIHCTSGDIYNMLALQEFTIDEVYPNDMALTGFNVPLEAVNGQVTDFEFTVFNRGKFDQKDYSIELYDVASADEPVLLTTLTELPEIKANTTQTFKVQYTPSTTDATITLRAKLVLADDASADDNESAVRVLNVLPEGAIPFNKTVYEEDGTNQYDTTGPISILKTDNDAQLLYEASDLNAEDNLEIHKIAFEYYGGDPYTTDPNYVMPEVSGINAMLYLGNTDKTHFEDKFDVVTDKTLVYTGELKFEQGENILTFELDEPFEYDHTKSLYINLVTSGPAYYDYLVRFMMYNVVWDDDNEYHFIRNWGTANSMFAFHQKYKLHLAVKDLNTGIETIVGGSDKPEFDSTTGTLHFNGLAVDNVAVYDAAGRLCETVKTAGQSAAKLSLANGVYLIRTYTQDGKADTLKVVVK